MKKTIGIDLGTTNSVAAIKRVNTEVLKNAEGDTITPSCVTVSKKKWSFSKDSSFIVGKHALEWLKQCPENTIVSIKRLMGRNYTDEDIKRMVSENRFCYKISEHSKGTENSIAISVNKKEYTPEQISSEILKKIKKDCEKVLCEQIEYAVITVPAYFNDKQKHATRTAAALAGLKVQRLLPEPTAAAITFGVESLKGDDAKTVLIYDFGGGTFDISILTISGGQFIEQGKGGDMWLGGDDIDNRIIDYVLEQTAKDNEIVNICEFIDNQLLDRKKSFLGELKSKVEKAKIELTSKDETFIEILGVLQDKEGYGVDVEVELTRKRFNSLILPIVERSVSLTKQLVSEINFTKDLIDNVFLVGGSSLIPLIIDKMKEEFGEEKVMVHDRPMLTNAEGAAVLSHRLAGSYECPKCSHPASQTDKKCTSCEFDLEKYMEESGIVDIVHTTAHDYYIYLENNEKHLLVEKNTPLPLKKAKLFKLVDTEQKLVHLKFVNMVNDTEESIGDLWLGINLDYKTRDKYGKDKLQIELTMDIDTNNLIGVTAKLKEFPDVKLSKTLSRGKADEKLFLLLEKSIDETNRNKYSHYITMDFTERSLFIINDIHKIVDQKTETVNESFYNAASLNIDKAVRLAKEEKTSFPVIYYAEDMIGLFSQVIPSAKRKALEDNIVDLKKMDERGTYEETVKAQDKLSAGLNGLGMLNELMQIQNASDICYNTEPAKAPKFDQSIKNIISHMQKGEYEKVQQLFSSIMPEVYSVNNKEFSRAGHIHKNITV